MSDLLKDIYTVEFLNSFADKVHAVYKNFDTNQFMSTVLCYPWDDLALKARIHRIAEVLGEHLPKNFEDALQILFSINESCTGFPYLFFPDL